MTTLVGLAVSPKFKPIIKATFSDDLDPVSARSASHHCGSQSVSILGGVPRHTSINPMSVICLLDYYYSLYILCMNHV